MSGPSAHERVKKLEARGVITRLRRGRRPGAPSASASSPSRWITQAPGTAAIDLTDDFARDPRDRGVPPHRGRGRTTCSRSGPATRRDSRARPAPGPGVAPRLHDRDRRRPLERLRAAPAPAVRRNRRSRAERRRWQATVTTQRRRGPRSRRSRPGRRTPWRRSTTGTSTPVYAAAIRLTSDRQVAEEVGAGDVPRPLEPGGALQSGDRVARGVASHDRPQPDRRSAPGRGSSTAASCRSRRPPGPDEHDSARRWSGSPPSGTVLGRADARIQARGRARGGGATRRDPRARWPNCRSTSGPRSSSRTARS